MYHEFFPPALPANWFISDDDPDNNYIELLGFDGEFLVSISYEPDENSIKPYFLNLQQMKGAFQRYDYTSFGIGTWYSSSQAASMAAFDLLVLLNENYGKFLPVSQELWVSLGPSNEMEQVQKRFGGDLRIHDGLVLKEILFHIMDEDLMATAKRIVHTYIHDFNVLEQHFEGGTIYNENNQKLYQLDYFGRIINENPIRL